MKKTIEEKRQNVLEVATKLFAEKGYEATTMAEIAKFANVGFGTVATYFENKENLLLKCVEEPMTDFLEKALSFKTQPNDYKEEINQMTLHHFKLFSEKRLYLLLLIHVTSQWEKYMKPYLIANKAARELSDKIELLIQNGQREGKIAEANPNILAISYVSVLLGLFLSNTDQFSENVIKLYAENATRLFGLQ
ncbi:TetR/AcrR family transcriptional regulator [Solibacillus sp. FSL R5-0691]|uniref:TetR/AcrR family transcriptional regulator n=1 Tax=Solibacillus sp. FSL R5-0691 TaxID=2921653 RepID=UPI0030D5E16B